MQDGRYTIVYQSGEYRTLWFRTPRKGTLAGKQILKIKVGTRVQGIGFPRSDGHINFWKSAIESGEFPLPRRVQIQRAVDRVWADPEKAGLAYAMATNHCYRCNKELSVPASIHRGMGPECAKKKVKKADNVRVYDVEAMARKHKPHAGMCNLDDPVCKAYVDMRIAHPGWTPQTAQQTAFEFEAERRSFEAL